MNMRVVSKTSLDGVKLTVYAFEKTQALGFSYVCAFEYNVTEIPFKLLS